MDRTHWDRIEDVFFRAAALSASDRDAFLDDACHGDDAFRREVGALLAAAEDDRALKIENTLLSPEFVREIADRPVASEGAGVGAWRLIRLLGRGGMGEVWLAERADGAFEQKGALKLMSVGWRAAELVTRFHRERQLLARLSHPNVATLLDGGVTERGIPFLVMEYVDGMPITDWCAKRQLDLSARLRLFQTLCDAVQFAHTNLVVHRDLKPANILVTEDGRPVLLDFGIAKLLDPSSANNASTRDGDQLLTPERGAPEQLTGRPVTAATDVWALGVLLFELATGRRPFNTDGKEIAEIERLICDEAAPLASEMVEEGRAALRGDVDCIVARAMSKDPERRYRSAGELGDDVGRHVAGLPIRARPDTFRYRAQKFVLRHRAAMLAACAFSALLLAFAALTWRQSRVVARERDLAIASQRTSDRVADVLVDIFRETDPRVHPGADTLRATDLLRLGEERVDELDDAPRVRVRLWQAFADLHRTRSQFREERELLDRALEEATSHDLDDETLALRAALATSTRRLEGSEAAEPLMREVLDASERRYGTRSVEAAQALLSLAATVENSDERRAILDRALAIVRREFPAPSIEQAEAWNARGMAEWTDGEMLSAIDAFERALENLDPVVGADHPHAMAVRNNLAVARQRMGDLSAAEDELRQLLEARRRVLGEDTIDAALTAQNLGVLLVHTGRHAEAAEHLREALRIQELVLGAEHTSTISVRFDVGRALALAGRIDEGLAIMADASEQAERLPDVSERWTQNLRIRSLEVDLALDRPVEVAEVRALSEEFSDDSAAHREIAIRARTLLGCALLAHNAEPTKTVALFEALVAEIDSTRGPMHPALAHARCGLAAARAVAGLEIDRAALRDALARAEGWGLAQPVVLRRARDLVD